LALLWKHVRNLEAVTVLARRRRVRLRPAAVPPTTEAGAAAFYRAMPLPLVRYLWATVADGAAFRELLRRGDGAAVAELRERYNVMPDRAAELPTPAGKSTDKHPILLALLWSLGGNADALAALALRELGQPLPKAIAEWPAKFLVRLWALSRDGAALAELWRREEKLDVGVPEFTSET